LDNAAPSPGPDGLIRVRLDRATFDRLADSVVPTRATATPFCGWRRGARSGPGEIQIVGIHAAMALQHENAAGDAIPNFKTVEYALALRRLRMHLCDRLFV
jgi:hypothetical protein